MRTKTIMLTALFLLGLSSGVSAKDVKENKKAEVTFLVSMTCEICHNRIEDLISFEEGETGLDVNLPQKTVTIEYRKDKTTPDKLKTAIRKLGYTVTPFHKTKDNSKEPSK